MNLNSIVSILFLAMLALMIPGDGQGGSNGLVAP